MIIGDPLYEIVMTSVILLPSTARLSYGRSPFGLLPNAFSLPSTSRMTSVDLFSPSGEMVVKSHVPSAACCAWSDAEITRTDATMQVRMAFIMTEVLLGRV